MPAAIRSSRFLQGLWSEIIPTVPAPQGVDLKIYAGDLLARFQNPAIRHRTWQIAMDGSQKLPQRLLGTIRERLKAGAPIDHLALGVAAWMAYVAGTDEKGAAIDVRDPLAAEFATRAKAAGRNAAALSEALFGLGAIFGDDLPREDRFHAGRGGASRQPVPEGREGDGGDAGLGALFLRVVLDKRRSRADPGPMPEPRRRRFRHGSRVSSGRPRRPARGASPLIPATPWRQMRAMIARITKTFAGSALAALLLLPAGGAIAQAQPTPGYVVPEFLDPNVWLERPIPARRGSSASLTDDDFPPLHFATPEGGVTASRSSSPAPSARSSP